MTLRQALLLADLPEVFRLIYEKDQRNIAKCDRPSLETTVGAYSKVVAELLSKPITKPYPTMSWVIREETDWYDNSKYPNVGFINHNYVAPTEGLKAWGGDGKTPVPEGYYDCNDDKYNQYFAAGFTSWSETIDTPIVNELNYPLNELVAEMLWEITFYGWTEAKQAEFVKEIQSRLDDVREEINGYETQGTKEV